MQIAVAFQVSLSARLSGSTTGVPYDARQIGTLHRAGLDQELADPAAIHRVALRPHDLLQSRPLEKAHPASNLAEALARAARDRPRDVPPDEDHRALESFAAREQHTIALAVVEEVEQVGGRKGGEVAGQSQGRARNCASFAEQSVCAILQPDQQVGRDFEERIPRAFALDGRARRTTAPPRH